MNKQQVLKVYEASDMNERKAITGAALDYLRERNVNVQRSALNYWRHHSRGRSPVEALYLEAYRHGVSKHLEQMAEMATN